MPGPDLLPVRATGSMNRRAEADEDNARKWLSITVIAPCGVHQSLPRSNRSLLTTTCIQPLRRAGRRVGQRGERRVLLPRGPLSLHAASGCDCAGCRGPEISSARGRRRGHLFHARAAACRLCESDTGALKQCALFSRYYCSPIPAAPSTRTRSSSPPSRAMSCSISTPRVSPPVHRAAGHGAAEAVIAALEKGVDINHRATNGMTALAFAANKGHENIAHVLIERGARLEPGYPLILAASNGHAAVVRLLLEHGADADATADALGGTTALHAAATMGQADAVDALLEGGADPFFEIELLGTPLQAATSYAHQYSRDENDALRREVKATNGGNFKGVLRSLRKAVAARSKKSK